MKFQWKKLLIAWMSLFALMGTANAGLLFEPYVGYDLSMSGELATAPEVRNANFASMDFGARIGWMFGWLGVGVEFDWKKPALTWEAVEGKSEYDKDAIMTNGGAFVGIYLGKRKQWIIRGKYNFMSNAKSEFGLNGSSATLEYKGMGYGFGIGYKFISWLALNVDYNMTTYDELSGNSNVAEFKTSDILISVSFPLEFFSKSSSR